jgi:uncharacterized protein YndB with AHSA1/START domain
VPRNDILIDAPPSRVYETLLDAEAYPRWVLGAKQLRGTDDTWPKPKSRFHHKVGVGPLSLADNTKLLETERDRRVVLEVRIRPLGVGRVRFDLKPRRRGRSTKVVMTERPTGGPWAWFARPWTNLGIRVRNAISLRRLRRVVLASTSGDR